MSKYGYVVVEVVGTPSEGEKNIHKKEEGVELCMRKFTSFS